MERHLQFLRVQLDALRTSLWFIPTAMGLAAPFIAALTSAADGVEGQDVPWFLYVGAAQDARDLLGNLFSSMITMASLVFSITMVVLTLAASQFGPRLIRNFTANWQTQIVLGTYILTIAYCLLSFASIDGGEGEGPFVYFSVSLAIALTLLSVGLLILHIHALARSIMSETIIAVVGDEIDTGISELAPLSDGEEENPETLLPKGFWKGAARCGLERAGYIQAIEVTEIVSIARKADVVIGLRFRAGDYVVDGGKEIAIYPAERASAELRAEINRCVTVGVHRTPAQDIEFSVRHLVEIAVRALSPSTNDPYTAASVINRLSVSLSHLMRRDLPPGAFRDGEQTVRVVCERPSYASFVGAAFHQIRQNGGDKPLILIHLLDAIKRIAVHVRIESQREALREEVRRVQRTADHEIDEPSDRASIEEHAKAALQALGGEGEGRSA